MFAGPALTVGPPVDGKRVLGGVTEWVLGGVTDRCSDTAAIVTVVGINTALAVWELSADDLDPSCWLQGGAAPDSGQC